MSDSVEDQAAQSPSVVSIPVVEPVPENELSPDVPLPPPAPDSMEVCTQYITNYFEAPTKFSLDQVKISLKHICHHLAPFYYFHSILMQIRQILFLINEHPDRALALQWSKNVFASLASLLVEMKPNSDRAKVLNQIMSSCMYEKESCTMDFPWRQQYAFEENCFNPDEHLGEYLETFNGTIDPNTKWSQFSSFTNEIVRYLQTQYGLPDDMPQLNAFASRALYSWYLLSHPLFPKPTVHEQYNRQVAQLRRLPGSGFLIREKFMPPGSFHVPVESCPGLYKWTVSEANGLSFCHLPDDLFRIIGNIHDFLFEELVKIQFVRAKTQTTLAQFRPTVQVGQEDIMPIVILVLVLADIPNLPDIVDFFNEYSTHIQINSKTGLYMANIATAFGAIMNWSFE